MSFRELGQLAYEASSLSEMPWATMSDLDRAPWRLAARAVYRAMAEDSGRRLIGRPGTLPGVGISADLERLLPSDWRLTGDCTLVNQRFASSHFVAGQRPIAIDVVFGVKRI